LPQLADGHLPPEPYFPPAAADPRPGILTKEEAERLTADPLAWFTAERVNLLATVEQVGQDGRVELACLLASRQCAFQHLQHRHDDAERLWRMIAHRADQSGDHHAQAAYARLRVSASRIERGHAADAQTGLDRCVEEFEQYEMFEALAFALYWRAVCAWDLDHFECSVNDAERGIVMARRAQSRLAELMNLRELGNALAWLGDRDRAVGASESALAIAVELGVPSYENAALHSLALTYTLTGWHDRAVAVCLQRIELSKSLGDIRGVAVSLGILGDAYQGLGRYQESASSLLRALPIFRDYHADRHHAVCLLKLGYACEAMGSPEAIDYLEESMQIFRRLRLPCKAEEAQRALDQCRAAIAI
jgi:tetratricopeptide (TPR) repeat protein